MLIVLVLAALAGVVFLLSRKPKIIPPITPTPPTSPILPEPFPPMPLPPNCEGLRFTELAKCYIEGNYQKAWGWVESTGQTGFFPYTPVPLPWEFDPDYKDERGAQGSHGGCPNCIMTLIHLRKLI